MAKEYSIVANIVAKTEQFTKGLNAAKDQANSFAKGFSDKTKAIGDGMNKVGKNMSTYVTAPLAGLGAAAVATFTSFDDSMRKVEATMGTKLGKTTQEVEKNTKSLRDEAKRLGSTTAFSASQAAQGMEKLALAGWDTNQILNATGPMLNLASAGAMDLDTAADIVTDTMSAFGMSADHAGKATDIFAKVSSSSNTDVTQLGEAMKYAGSSANAAGMDLEQTAAILGKLADAGIKGSSGGTVLNAMLRDVKKNAEEGAIAIGKTSVAVYDSNGNMRDMTSILSDIESSTAGMTGAQKDAALSAIFQDEAMRGVNIALEAGTDSIVELEEALRNSDGTAQQMAEHMEGGIGGAFRSLKSSAEGLAISIGETLAPYIQKAAEFFSDLNLKLTNMDSGMKNAIIIVGLIAAGIGPLLMVLGTMISSVGAVAGAFAAISAPVALAIAALVGIVAYFATVGIKSDELKTKISSAFEFIKGAIALLRGDDTEASDIFAKLGLSPAQIEDIIGSVNRVKEAFTVFKGVIEALFMAIAGDGEGANNLLHKLGFSPEQIAMFMTAVENVKGFITTLQQVALAAFNGIRTAVTEVFAFILPYVQPILEAIVTFISEKLGMITTFWNENGTQIKTAVDNLFNGIMAVIQFIMPAAELLIKTVWTNIKGAIDGALNLIMGLIKTFSSLFTGDWKGLWEGIKQTLSGAVELVWNVLNLLFYGKIIKLVKSLATGALNLIKTMGTNIVSSFKSLASNAGSAVSSLVSNVVKFFTNLFNKAKSIYSNIRSTGETAFNSLKNTVSSVASGIYNSVKNHFTNMYNTAKGKMDSILTKGRTIFDSLKSAITTPIETAKSTFMNTVDAIKNAFNFTWKLPKLKLPSVSVSMNKNSWGIPIPKFNISWFKKGGIFDQASLVGLAEAGKEAILPIEDKNAMRPFSAQVAQQLSELLPYGQRNPASDETGEALVMNNTFNFTVSGNGKMTNKEAKEISNFVSKNIINSIKKRGK
ncbi:phage tail tape measure protein [Jeotgalibacillus malaysiensis]|uniref:phage tail tape measure protein n=1 Tax=Jeotgalibacillus malaysiensis TaxID=1508404 RepID=UPI00384D26FE